MLFIPFIFCAAVITIADVSSVGSPPFWLACGMSVLIFAIWGYFRIIEQMGYEVRTRKFAAVNNYTFTAKIDREKLPKDESFLSKLYSSSRKVYIQHLIEGKHGRIPFKFGVYAAEYSGPEGEMIVNKISFLRFDLKTDSPHILFVGGGGAIPNSAIKQLWTGPQPTVTDFQHRFRIFVLEGKKDWQEVVPPNLQQEILELDQDFDIEIKEGVVSFYQTKRLFNLKQVPRIFEIVSKLKEI